MVANPTVLIAIKQSSRPQAAMMKEAQCQWRRPKSSIRITFRVVEALEAAFYESSIIECCYRLRCYVVIAGGCRLDIFPFNGEISLVVTVRNVFHKKFVILPNVAVLSNSTVPA